jgi:hypothetical protein
VAATAFDLRQPELAAQELREANEQLARAPEVSGAIEDLINEVADGLIALDADDFTDDPYLLAAIERAALHAKRAMDLDDKRDSRRQARLALDDLYRFCALLAERQPVSADRDGNAVARWLVESARLPARQVAPLIGVHERTLQRWAAEPPESTPSGEEERMLRSVAQVVAQLRYTLTAPGVLEWMRRPAEDLDGEVPAEKLKDPTGLPTVLASARNLRALPFA